MKRAFLTGTSGTSGASGAAICHALAADALHVIALANNNTAAVENLAALIVGAGTPDDVASVVRFLTSERAGYITGQVIAVSAGLA